MTEESGTSVKPPTDIAISAGPSSSVDPPRTATIGSFSPSRPQDHGRPVAAVAVLAVWSSGPDIQPVPPSTAPDSGTEANKREIPRPWESSHLFIYINSTPSNQHDDRPTSPTPHPTLSFRNAPSSSLTMKFLLPLLSATAAFAHTIFSSLEAGGVNSGVGVGV
ncbi:endoglucanase II (glycosyl hydrolase family 61) [Colletotrichum chrysophilum]|uniref:Endoglucanase II (Glycosyl hydrolase family 61) n=1 Tax=Colletotrichum chrysophilum TaxID=1836956 RepID=A0AAD9AY70_9PEZI|nr:endoglucanase II (glycosyl hydrolase family 61) [Colletotrichum chrysophilum]